MNDTFPPLGFFACGRFFRFLPFRKLRSSPEIGCSVKNLCQLAFLIILRNAFAKTAPHQFIDRPNVLWRVVSSWSEMQRLGRLGQQFKQSNMPLPWSLIHGCALYASSGP